ncbi:hypothetical protein ACRE_056020 [Hapsidospora chrysogenum ATCC 11550]|uniref:Uncharacterized protein n=1 Tax=Hapsidospora chrysogenum (strain ATCC 11550 / CBS 779.69 / DSM 880 / IAM 14645 / JCM 23072 / IMI 49137) TaxID=857340 RepID=A0A086T2Q1_HAPC1|nr:hypothetical protein ACRE_056020 [Hapsidospora chrysogenum ATCC 11550]
MVQTRAQTKGNPPPAAQGPKTERSTTSKTSADGEDAKSGRDHDQRSKTVTTSPDKNRQRQKVQLLLEKYGRPPLADVIREDWPSSKVVTVHIMNALLSSTRISHEIAHETLRCLVDEGYHDLGTLRDSSWEARTEVLTRGGYTHYRERTATYLGDLSELMQSEYDNDASRILPSGDDNPRETLSKRLKTIKGLGPMGCDIFLGAIQGFFPDVAPFMVKRNFETAEKIGLVGDTDELFALVDRDPEKMAMLHEALTTVRLDKKEHELK